MGAAFLPGWENPTHPVVEGGRVHVMVVVGYKGGSPWDGVPLDQDHGEAGIGQTFSTCNMSLVCPLGIPFDLFLYVCGCILCKKVKGS